MSSPETEFVNTIIRAGAGAGKTYGLIHKIADLVREYSTLHPGQLPRFVVTTFTRKATQEVRERLLAKALELRQTEPDFGDRFLHFLKSSGFLLISTIHGVLNQFLREQGYLIGLDPDFKVTQDSEPELTRLLHQMLVEEPLFAEMVKKYGWRRLKLFLLAHHRSYLLNPEVSPLTEAMINQHWSAQLEQLLVVATELNTFLAPMALKSKGMALKNFVQALTATESVLSRGDDLWSTLEKIKALDKDFPKSLGSLAQWDPRARDLRKEFSLLFNGIVDDPWSDKDAVKSHLTDEQTLGELGKTFSQLWLKQKIAKAEIGMDDLELLSLYILRHFPAKTNAFSDSWNYWFIDEYQDTSPLQVEILKLLIGDRQHYVVGDPQQSIYFFRGARSKVFHEKFAEFASLSARTEVKTINRRSTAPTLAFINDLMDLVNKHQFSAMDPLSPDSPDEKLVGHFYLRTQPTEDDLTALVEVLRGLLTQGVNPAEIAVLCRENQELRKVSEVLEGAGLPAAIASQGRFLDDEIIKDALALWTFLVNPHDNPNLIQLLRSQWFKVDDSLIFEAAQNSRGSLWKSLKGLSHPSVTELANGISQLALFDHIEVWTRLLMATTAVEDCCERDPGGRKEGNLWKLIAFVHEQNRKGSLNMTDPLDLGLATDSNNENETRSIRESQQIQLMTIHGSKGLEFDHVVLPFLNHHRKRESTDFWTIDLANLHWSVAMVDPKTRAARSGFYARNISEEVTKLLEEESERLFYVAVTRARRGLHFFPPKAIDDLSPTGWARHLTPFIDKGEGHFKSDSGRYEFLVTNEEQIPRTAEHRNPEIVTVTAVPPLPPLVERDQDTISITELVNQTADAEKGSRNAPIWETEILERGVAIHRELEAYAASGATTLLSPELASWLEQTEAPLKTILQNGFPEWPFSIKTKTKTIDGQIDLWGRDQLENLWIIDYKTGSSRFVEKAFKQLSLYAWALQQSPFYRANEPIHLAVCYPLEKLTQVRVLNIADLHPPEFAHD